MAQAKRDQNNVTVAMGVLNSDGTTPTMLEASPTSHVLQTSDGSTGDDNSADGAYRDENSITTLLAVSESDGATPVPLYVDSDGNLLIDSN